MKKIIPLIFIFIFLLGYTIFFIVRGEYDE